MSEQTGVSTAEVRDRHTWWIAVAVLVMGLRYAASASAHLLVGTPPEVVEVVEVGLMVLFFGIIAPIIAWKLFRMPAGERHLYLNPDGFIADAFRRAHKVSWAVVFLLLIFMEVISDRFELPAEFYIQVAIAAMLGALGIAFFVLARDEAGEA